MATRDSETSGIMAGLPDETDEVSRQEMAEAGLLAFFAMAEQWQLSTHEQRALLGNPGRSRFFDLKSGRRVHLSDDEMDRLAYLTGIYATLQILYSPENTRLWLTNPSEPTSIWRGLSPLQYMLGGKMMALLDVYRYLNGLRGAA